MSTELGIKLVEGLLTNSTVALHQKRAQGRLGKLAGGAVLVEQGTELHVDVGELRKRLAVAADSAVAKRQQPLFPARKCMRLQAAQPSKGNLPFRKFGRGEKLQEHGVVYRLNLRTEKRARFGNACHQIVELRFARERLGIGRILGGTQPGVVAQPLDLEINLFVAFQSIAKLSGRLRQGTCVL